MKQILLAVLFAGAALAQPRVVNTYTATCTLTLSAAAGACTIQQPASGSATVQLVAAYIETSAAITFTQERNGTAATATSATARAVNPDISDAARALVYTASNVGSGTTITDAISVAASGNVTLDLTDIQMRGNGTSKNYTVRVASATATVKVMLKWREY